MLVAVLVSRMANFCLEQVIISNMFRFRGSGLRYGCLPPLYTIGDSSPSAGRWYNAATVVHEGILLTSGWICTVVGIAWLTSFC
jgi:hypothetical protein